MSPDDLLNLLHIKPFQSFRLCMTDGEQYEVRHPDAIRIAGRTAVVFVRKTDVPSAFLYDRFDVVSLLHVVRVRITPARRPSQERSLIVLRLA
jgi:hypothetical protein